jgi:hypothetical protein
VLVDHDEIRQWAEERNAVPVHVKGTGGNGDVGILRLHFPEFSDDDEKLEPISWEDWFNEFDQRNLALLVEDTTADGQRSNFNKLVSRETAERGLKRQSGSARGKSRRKAA